MTATGTLISPITADTSLHIMPSNTVDFYSRQRDLNGVPVLFPETWPRFEDRVAHEIYLKLRSQSARLCECYGQIDFLRARVLPTSMYNQTYHVVRGRQSDTLVKTTEEETEELACHLEKQTAILRLLYKLQAVLAIYQLGPAVPSVPVARRPAWPYFEPQMLLRIFEAGVSYTPYSAELGFHSSDSRIFTQARSVQALKDSGVLSDNSLRSHCEGYEKSSPWISLTDNTQWLLEKSPLSKKPSTKSDQRRVAFINVERLNRMGVIFQRTDLLALQAKIPVYSGANRKGVKFTSVDHWLVYDWIPVQCIERIVSFQEYQRLYAAQGMKGQHKFLVQ
jgi:hypothetical protein